MLSVWAFGPGIMYDHGRVSRTATRACVGHGASGTWDPSIAFENLPDLAHQLSHLQQISASYEMPRPVPPGSIRRLAINVHGFPGECRVDVNPAKALNVRTFLPYEPELMRIGAALHGQALVYLMCCTTGQGQAGSDLLRLLSNCWRGRLVIAYTTILVGERQSRGGVTTCRYPDAFETDELNANEAMRVINAAESSGFPLSASHLLAGEASPHAKVALNGHIIHLPEEERRNVSLRAIQPRAAARRPGAVGLRPQTGRSSPMAR